MVREYQDVFPDELPILPPSKELDFFIDLIHGAKLIAKAPYRLAFSELVETG